MKKQSLTVALAGTVAAAAAAIGLAGASSASPAANPVQVRYRVDGKPAGAGTAIEYAGHLYISLGGVKTLTGTQLNWDAAGSTVSAGAAPSSAASGYLEDLTGQPYYVTSAALCWQWAKDSSVSKMQSFVNSAAMAYPCNLSLPAKPTMGGQHYTRDLAVLVSANGSRDTGASNTVTMDFNLLGHYQGLSATLGLADHLNRSAMLVKFVSNNIVLFSTALQPGSLPSPISVNVAGAQAVQLVIANVSGGAPNWNELENYQYDPGAVVLANPRLSG